MICGFTVLAIVPARGGSKGILLKNLRQVGGRPLIALVGDVIREVPEIDRAVVSTDHPKIAAIARESGLDTPFLRPDAISGDSIGSVDVLIHALIAVENIDGRRYDLVVMLEPTSPLRRPDHVSSALRMLVDGGWDSVWSVSTTDSKAHPLKQLVIEDGVLEYYDPQGAAILARQQLAPVYHRNGIAYAMTRACLVEQRSIKGKRAGAFVVAGEHVSIDSEEDIALVEWILTRRGRTMAS